MKKILIFFGVFLIFFLQLVPLAGATTYKCVCTNTATGISFTQSLGLTICGTSNCNSIGCAEGSGGSYTASCQPETATTGVGSSGSGSSGPSDPVSLQDPLGFKNSATAPQEFIGRIIKAALGLIGSISLFMFILGGYTWMTSAGNPEKVKKGTETMLWAFFGLVVVFSAYSLTNWVLSGMLGNP